MKYYLVVRDPKTKENTDILQYDSMAEAMNARTAVKKKSGGEVVPVYARDIKAMLNTFTEYRPTNWRDYIKKYMKQGSTMLHNPTLEKKMTVDDIDVHLTARSLPGSREFPPEGAEVDVKHATLAIPDLSEMEAEQLPTAFDVQKHYTYDENNEEIDLVLTFHVQVKSKNLKGGKVEIDYEDTLKDWDYY